LLSIFCPLSIAPHISENGVTMADANSIRPGFVTRSAANLLRDAVDVAYGNRQELDNTDYVPAEQFPASITAYDSATGYYSWTERSPLSDGTLEDKPGGRTGTPTWSPAIAIGGGTNPSTYPFDVWLRRRVVFSGGVAYDFQLPASGGTTTKMCRIVDPIVSIDSARPNVVQAYTVKWAGPLATDYEDDELIWLELL
jgi:hypothetical protein